MSALIKFVQIPLFNVEDLDKLGFIKEPSEQRLQDNKSSTILKVKKYMQKKIFEQKRQVVIKLPSVDSLQRCFDVTLEELYQAFIELQQSGFDYKIIDRTCPIMFWDSLAITSSEK